MAKCNAMWENKGVVLGFPKVQDRLGLGVCQFEKLQALLTKNEPVNI